MDYSSPTGVEPVSVLFGRISAHTSLLSLKISGYFLRPMPRLNENPLRKNCKAHFGEKCSDDFGCGGRRLSLTNINRTRSAGHLSASDFISFFAGRQPSCIIQFRLTQKYAPAESAISECV